MVMVLSVMDIRSNNQPFQVGFVLVDGFPLMSYASAMEPLRAANLLAQSPLYEVRHMPVAGARSTSSSGAMIGADAFPGEQVNFDLVLVVAGGNLADQPVSRLNDWLQLLASRGVILGGVSGGPLLLARAGVMEERRMTVHWDHAAALAEVSQRLLVERSLYVRDRDRLTCAGGTAPLDMMHTLISEHHGPEFARRISDWFMHTDIRQGEAPQRSGLAERYDVMDPVALKALEAMENHIADPLELTQLATLVGISVRQLNRIFQIRLGASTVQFYTQMRLRKAQLMLRMTALDVQDVALATGFASGAHLSRRFRQRYEISPTGYRESLTES